MHEHGHSEAGCRPWAGIVAAAVLLLFVPAQADARGGDRWARSVWEDVSLGLPTTDLAAVAGLPGDAEVVLVGGSGFVYRTDDSGDSWHMALRVVASAGKGAGDDEDEDEDEDENLDELSEEYFEQLFSGAEQVGGVGYAEAIESSLREQAQELAEAEVERLRARSKREDDDGGDLQARGADQRIRRIRTFQKHPALVLVCSEQGLYRSTDGGRRYELVRLAIGAGDRVIEDVLVLDDGRIVAATEGGVIVKDPTEAARRSTTPRRNQPVRALLYHSQSGRILAGTDDGILVSRDRGGSFTYAYVPAGGKSRKVRALASPATMPRVVLAGTDGGLLRSKDGGRNFRAVVPAGLGTTPVRRMAVAEGEPHVLLATARGVFHTEDGGLSFKALRAGLADDGVRDVATSRLDKSLHLWAATRSGVHRFVPRAKVKRDRHTWLLLKRIGASDPSVTEVLDRATERMFLSPSIAKGLASRLRWRWAGPFVSFEHRRAYERNVTQPHPFDPNQPYLGEDISVVPTDEETRLEVFFELRDLIFDPTEMTIQQYRERATKKRRRLRQRVAKMYGARRVLILRLLTTHREGRSFRRRLQQLATLTANLDALTGNSLRWAQVPDILKTKAETEP